MAQGSEQISQKWIEGAKRECVKCGREIKNLDRDVGEVRSRYGPKGHGTREIVCSTCSKPEILRR